jgi:hypothetical protein
VGFLVIWNSSFKTLFEFGSYTKGCNSIHALSSEPNEFSYSRRFLRDDAEWDHACVGIGASHSEMAIQYNKTAAARGSRGG